MTTPREPAATARPVLVWLHGGSFRDGASHLYGADRLATQGDVVVVTVNYRVGAFGFLAHPALDGASPEQLSGNYGLQDQQAALSWVQQNIAAFGGDPTNVTLFGESGGGTGVCAHLAAPRSGGLFHRAIMQSSPCDREWSAEEHTAAPRARDTAERQGIAIAERLGCTDLTTAARCLREQAVPQVREHSEEGEGLGPVYGGGVLPVAPATALRSGRMHRVPVLLGMNRDEERFMLLGSHPDPLDATGHRAELAKTFGARTSAVADEHRCQPDQDCRPRLASALTDAHWAIPLLDTGAQFAKRAPTYLYEFADQRAPGMRGLPEAGYPLGAYHTAELPFLFTVDWAEELTPEQRQLSADMIDYWTRFARTGDPNGAAAPRWRRHDTDRYVHGLATGPGALSATDFEHQHRVAFWRHLGQ